jgi:hypothetical protein
MTGIRAARMIKNDGYRFHSPSSSPKRDPREKYTNTKEIDDHIEKMELDGQTPFPIKTGVLYSMERSPKCIQNI